MVRRDRLVTVPHGNVRKANKLTACRIHRQHGVHKNSAQKAAPANRSKAGLPHLRAAQNNLAAILNGQNVPALNPFSGSSARSFAQGLNSHRRIAQETAKPDLSTSQPTAKFQNARAGMRHKCMMTPGPLFCRRRSPNPPTENRSNSPLDKLIMASRFNPSNLNQ